jgi:hypothetical protein
MTVRVTGTCLGCNGERMVDAPHCASCGRGFMDSELAGIEGEEQLPCGCDLAHFDRMDCCVECEGKGELTRTVSLAELVLLLDSKQVGELVVAELARRTDAKEQ